MSRRVSIKTSDGKEESQERASTAPLTRSSALSVKRNSSRASSNIVPSEIKVKPEPNTAPITRSSALSVKRNSSRASTNIVPSEIKVKPEPKTESATEANAASNESALVQVSMGDLFSDDCERYTKDCNCCHCAAVQKALKQVAFWKTPEGKQQLELKMHLKCFIMDANAMTYVRQMTVAKLKGLKPPFPTTDQGFPIAITRVVPIDGKCMSIDWYLHDPTNITHYEIYVDGLKRKRVFDPQQTSTVVIDVDMRLMHRIRMRAMPKKCVDSRPDPMDRLVKDVCCGNLEKILDADYFSCECNMKKRLEDLKEQRKNKPCAFMVNFWKDSEFLFLPE